MLFLQQKRVQCLNYQQKVLFYDVDDEEAQKEGIYFIH